jgi:hypothetical protein
MFSWIDWPVLTRQLLLVIVPVLVSRGVLPDYLADPTVELATYVIGTLIVGAVIAYGQRREQPKAKIEEVAALPQVSQIEVKSDALAASIESKKVVS